MYLAQSYINDSAWQSEIILFIKRQSKILWKIFGQNINLCFFFPSNFVCFLKIVGLHTWVDSCWWSKSGDLTRWTSMCMFFIMLLDLWIYKCVFQEPPEIILRERRSCSWNMKRTLPWRSRRWGKYVRRWGEDGQPSDTSASITGLGEQMHV